MSLVLSTEFVGPSRSNINWPPLDPFPFQPERISGWIRPPCIGPCSGQCRVGGSSSHLGTRCTSHRRITPTHNHPQPPKSTAQLFIGDMWVHMSKYRPERGVPNISQAYLKLSVVCLSPCISVSAENKNKENSQALHRAAFL